MAAHRQHGQRDRECGGHHEPQARAGEVGIPRGLFGVRRGLQHDAGARFSRGDYIGGGVVAAIWAVMGSLPFLALAQVLKYQRVQIALLARILESQH